MLSSQNLIKELRIYSNKEGKYTKLIMNEVVKGSHLLNKGQNKIMEGRLIKLSSKSIYPSLEKKLFALQIVRK